MANRFEPKEEEMLRDCAAQLRELAALAEEFGGASAAAFGVAGGWLAALSALLPPLPPPRPPSGHVTLVALFAARVVARRLAQFCDEQISPLDSSTEDEAAETFDKAVEKYVQDTYQMALKSLAEASSKIQLSQFSWACSQARLFSGTAASQRGIGGTQWCGAACHQGALLHAQHDQLPSDCTEVREVSAAGQLRLRLEPQQRSEEVAARRSLMHVRSAAAHEGRSRRRDTRLRHSIGSSHLDLVRQVARASEEEEKVGPVGFKAVEMPRLRNHKDEEHAVAHRDRPLVDKLWRFFDELAKRKYCCGPPLVVKVRRHSLVEDTFKALMAPSRIPLNYYSSVRVQFEEEAAAAAEDEEDALCEVAQALFSAQPPLRLFACASAESSHLYPNPASSALPAWFALCGALLALAFLHQRPLRAPLPRCFYKCLFDRPMSLSDLEELDPALLRRLQRVRGEAGAAGAGLTFTVPERMGARSYWAELVEGGAQVAVTEHNKRDYVDACLRWKLAERCLLQLQEIRNGFVAVLDPRLLDRFTEEELKAMIEQPLDYSEDTPLATNRSV